MHIPDLTKLVLSTTLWFLAGLALYYCLSLLKVYILAKLQPMILTDKTDAQKPFQHFFPALGRAVFSGFSLHKLTFLYLFKYRKTDWPVIGNEPVKKRLEILDGLTTFLKPYLITALLFCVLRIWIAGRLFYHPLAITLGEIQVKLSFIHSIPFVSWITGHKALVLLIYSLLVVLLIARAAVEAKAKKIKKYASISLVWFSILTNVSFFSAGIASSLTRSGQELTQLQVEIVEIHNKIFVDAAVAAVTIQSIDDYLSRIETASNGQTARIAEISKKEEQVSLDSSIINPLIRNLAQFVSQERFDNLLSVFFFDKFPPPGKAYLADKLIAPGSTTEPGQTRTDAGNAIAPEEAFLAAYAKSATGEPSDPVFDNYFADKAVWNKQEGTAILAQVESKESLAAGTGNATTIKTRKILELLFTYGLDAGLDQLYEVCHINPPKIFTKVASLVLEADYKQCVVRATGKKKRLPEQPFPCTMRNRACCSIRRGAGHTTDGRRLCEKRAPPDGWPQSNLGEEHGTVGNKSAGTRSKSNRRTKR
jgi:hypothetical protein